MPPENRFFEDIARVANGAFGAMAGLRGEVEALVRQRVDKLTADMNLVRRDEFDALRDLATKARNVQEDVILRLNALETRLAAIEAKLEPAKVQAKPTAKPAAAKPAASRVRKPPSPKTE